MLIGINIIYFFLFFFCTKLGLNRRGMSHKERNERGVPKARGGGSQREGALLTWGVVKLTQMACGRAIAKQIIIKAAAKNAECKLSI